MQQAGQEQAGQEQATESRGEVRKKRIYFRHKKNLQNKNEVIKSKTICDLRDRYGDEQGDSKPIPN